MEPLDFYTAVQTFIENENSLVNDRLSWMLVTQGLLMAAYTQLKVGTNPSGLSENLIGKLKSILPLVGLLSGLFVSIGVIGALDAIRGATSEWTSFLCAEKISQCQYPSLVGGLKGTGTISALGLCASFMGAWIWLLLIRKK